jgi:hypothetical protein
MVDLFCAIVGDGRIFPVEIDLDEIVGTLKEKILEETPDLKRFGAAALTLYLARHSDTWLSGDDDDVDAVEKGEIPDAIKTLMVNEMKPGEELNSDECFGKDFAPGKRELHVLVELPKPKKRCVQDQRHLTSVDDASNPWWFELLAASLASSALPSIDSLAEFVASPLPVKIGLTRASFEGMALHMDRSTLDKICVINEAAPCGKIYKELLAPALESSPAQDSHGDWKEVLHQPLTTVFEKPFVHGDASIPGELPLTMLRPCMFFKADGVCVFRGEVGVAGAALEPILRGKCMWWFGAKVPYVFGYTIEGNHSCTLYALSSPDEKTVETTAIRSYDTKKATQRVELILAVLQLARLVKGIIKLCPDNASREFVDFAQFNGIVVRLNPLCVVKDFTKFWSLDGASIDPPKIVSIYEQLKPFQIPHADELVHVSYCGRRLMFKPRGEQIPPFSLKKLFAAIECVLEALVVLHRNGWMHRDIRWPNVMQHVNNTKQWFLIDFEDAAPSPQSFPSGTHLRERTHAPEIFVEGGTHTTAVDLWSVGRLIKERDSESVRMNWTGSPRRRAFMLSLLHDDPSKRPTAQDPLETLRGLRRE